MTAAWIMVACLAIEAVVGWPEAVDKRIGHPIRWFGWLVERGMLEPGTVLTDEKRRHKARVRADGTLISSDFKGSIHQVGAHVQNLPACNGWTFWCIDVEGGTVPIDVLRQKLRAELH